MRVFHFLSVDNAIDDIRNRHIRISRFTDLNDPFELLAAKTDERGFRRGVRNWRTEMAKIYGLLCFTTSWKSPVLWSHYASKHRGVCLGFDLADELVGRVNYTADRMEVRFVNDKPELGLDESFVHDLLMTKYIHWKYEDEVRAFLRLDHNTEVSGSYFYDFNDTLQLREVVLGPLCEAPIEEIRTLVRSTYDAVTVVKSRLAFKWFDVVNDERSVRDENEYWKEKCPGNEPKVV